MIESVAKIAIPPPSGTVLSANLSLRGFATKPNRKAKVLARPVKIKHRKKELTKRTIATTVSI